MDIEKQINALQAKLNTAKAKAEKLADSGDDAWSKFSKDLDDKFEGFTSAIKGFFSKSD